MTYASLCWRPLNGTHGIAVYGSANNISITNCRVSNNKYVNLPYTDPE